jgi:hypothetical protein
MRKLTPVLCILITGMHHRRFCRDHACDELLKRLLWVHMIKNENITSRSPSLELQSSSCRPFQASPDPCTTWISPSVRSQSPASKAAQPPRPQNATSPASLIAHARPHSSSLDSRWYRPCHPPPDKEASGQAWRVYLHCSPNGSSPLRKALRRSQKSRRPAMTACSGGRTGRTYTLASGRASQRV